MYGIMRSNSNPLSSIFHEKTAVLYVFMLLPALFIQMLYTYTKIWLELQYILYMLYKLNPVQKLPQKGAESH